MSNPIAAATDTVPPTHRLFQLGIALKGLMGLTEAIAGTMLLTVSPAGLHAAVARAAHVGLFARSDHPLMRHLTHAAETLPIASQHFYAVYLILHGVLKLAMVTLLWRQVSWAYPAAIAIQLFFIAFETHRYLEAGNPVLLGLAILDAVIIWLIWREWGAHRLARAA